MSSITNLPELENSTDVRERSEYYRRAMAAVKQWEIDLAYWSSFDTWKQRNYVGDEAKEEHAAFLEKEKALLKGAKDKVYNYDVYQQKSVYRCWRCKEPECICNELAL